jgi:hypothetical protein
MIWTWLSRILNRQVIAHAGRTRKEAVSFWDSLFLRFIIPREIVEQ